MTHTCYLSLSPKECNSLLESIVDCEPSLYANIKRTAKIYSDNPEQYENECEAIEAFGKTVHIYQIDIGQVEHKNEKVYLHWYHRDFDYNKVSIYDLKTKTMIKE